jgi:hypothetical protein
MAFLNKVAEEAKVERWGRAARSSDVHCYATHISCISTSLRPPRSWIYQAPRHTYL